MIPLLNPRRIEEPDAWRAQPAADPPFEPPVVRAQAPNDHTTTHE